MLRTLEVYGSKLSSVYHHFNDLYINLGGLLFEWNVQWGRITAYCLDGNSMEDDKATNVIES